ncbi:MAG: O-methyltransferase [Bacteroidales bacterium]|nr:O-methyltransferase [Bacteroidales bacterium]
MESALDKYLEEHCSFNSEALNWLERQTNIRTNYPRMLSGRVQGAFLYMLGRMIRPQKVLEIGTFTGYSTICIALGLPEGGHVDTLEINDELQDLIEEGFSRSGTQDRITLHIGDALEFMKSVAENEYDMVFIDANKREYPEYYENAVRLTRPGGFILADDVLWDGKVYAENVPGDRQTAGIVRFNELAAGDPGVETVILPVRHGLSIIRKKEKED